MSVFLPARPRRRTRIPQPGSPNFWVYGLLTAFVLGSIFPFYWSFLVASRDSSMLTEQVPPLVPGGNRGKIYKWRHSPWW